MIKKLFFTLLSAIFISAASGQKEGSFSEENIPLKRVTLYSSGVAHYEHEGQVQGSGKINLFFSPAQINDVLKSLVVTDPAAKNLAVNYQSEDTLRKTMESLKINISKYSDLSGILSEQKGAEIEIITAEKITGKILSADKNEKNGASSPALSILTKNGIRIIPFSEIKSFKFTDEKRNEDLNTALDLLLQSSDKSRKQLSIDIESQGNKSIKLSYVMEAPIWKASYRLDAGNGSAALQAWAIIDNSTDIDWKNIKLTLTTGRPIGFKQNLYKPYYTYRKTVPLIIAGAAEAEIFKSAEELIPLVQNNYRVKEAKELSAEKKSADEFYDTEYYSEDLNYFEGQAETETRAGEMFVFTPSKPVNLDRQKSTKIPLALVSIPAEKLSVFSKIGSGKTVHPKFCIGIENTSGLKLPAGPITVLNNGEYAGDALLEFLPEKEKRLIAFGDDIEVSGSKTSTSENKIETVKITNSVLHIYSKTAKNTVYTIKNADIKERTVIVEHPINSALELTSTENLLEKTADKYRFKINIKGNDKAKLTVTETEKNTETMEIGNISNAVLVSITSNTEMPETIRKTVTDIINEKNNLIEAQKALKNLKDYRTELSNEQERIRKNLTAIGAETNQGQIFLNKLLQIENTIDELKKTVETAGKKLKAAEEYFTQYLQNIKI